MPNPYPSDHAIWETARRMGLDPYEVHFERVPSTALYEFAAYLIPGRMSHWTYGKAYQVLKTRHDYGQSKLYEMVVNANPAYAFLLDSNSELENTFVRCHVMGHVDFFHHNQCFAHTPKDMIETVGTHAERVRHYEFLHGQAAVEALLDAALSLQEHVDWPSPPGAVRGGRRTPITSRRDLLEFLLNESTVLEPWQRDVVGMVRQEMRYFWPQLRTKIMNEGWATYWHVALMHELELDNQDFTDFARLHAEITAASPYQFNPYALGYRIFREIAERWGSEELFLAREVYDDVGLIRHYLTEAVVEDLNLFVFDREADQPVVRSRAFKDVRQSLVAELVNAGVPVIEVESGDWQHRGELYLIHRHEGRDLDLPYAERTLQYVHRLWGRPVHLETMSEGSRSILSYDGRVNTKVVG